MDRRAAFCDDLSGLDGSCRGAGHAGDACVDA
jgi:hypothetical protein